MTDERLEQILERQRKAYEQTLDVRFAEQDRRFDAKLEEQRLLFERAIGVIAEDFQHKLGLVAEYAVGIRESLDVVKEMVAKNTEDIEMMKVDIGFIKKELARKADKEELLLLSQRVTTLERAA